MKKVCKCGKCGGKVKRKVNNPHTTPICEDCLVDFNKEHAKLFGVPKRPASEYKAFNLANIIKVFDVEPEISKRVTPHKYFKMGIKVCSCQKMMPLEVSVCPNCGLYVLAIVDRKDAAEIRTLKVSYKMVG